MKQKVVIFLKKLSPVLYLLLFPVAYVLLAILGKWMFILIAVAALVAIMVDSHLEWNPRKTK